MADQASAFDFLTSRPARILTGVLLLLALTFYSKARTSENFPHAAPLSQFPVQVGSWQVTREGVVEKEVQEVLKADDLLNRFYSSPLNGIGANLFVAYFRSQRNGKAPHSPKNCLPGAGWTPSESEIIQIPVANAAPLSVNRYLVSKGDNKSLVLYWYQSRDRAIASEYWAKIYLVIDAIRLNRSDTALVRVVVPVSEGTVEAADKAATDLIRALHPHVMTYFSRLKQRVKRLRNQLTGTSILTTGAGKARRRRYGCCLPRRGHPPAPHRRAEAAPTPTCR